MLPFSEEQICSSITLGDFLRKIGDPVLPKNKPEGSSLSLAKARSTTIYLHSIPSIVIDEWQHLHRMTENESNLFVLRSSIDSLNESTVFCRA